MTPIARNRLLLFIIAILLVANLALVYFFVKGKDRDKKHDGRERHGMSEQLKADVGFSEDQLKAYQLKRDAHMKVMRGLFEDIRTTKEEFFKTIADTVLSDSALLVKASDIGEKQKRIDITTHEYFRSVRKLCTQEQLPKYDTLYQKVVKRMISGRRPQSSGKEKDSLEKNKN